MKTTGYSRVRGFSLLEMAIVLAIVGLLMAGLLPSLTSQIEQQNSNETRKQLDEIQQALIGFALSNGRLPCPADRTIASGQANAGIEATTGSGSSLTCANITSNAAWGVLPWATLGVSETDAWGRRFTYRVSSIYADAITANTFGCSPSLTPGTSSFALCSTGNISIQSSATGGSIATSIPAVVVSHGINGLGAYTPQGTAVSTSSDADEADNSSTTNSIYVSHDISPTFDDLVVWISPNILFNRMVSAGKLP